MKRLYTKIKNAIKFGFVTRFIKDSENIPIVEVSYLKKTGLAELISPYGLSVGLPKDTQVLIFSVFGVESNRVAIGWSQKDRPKNLKEGEVVCGNFKVQSYIKFDENGDVNVNANNVNINASKVNLGSGGNNIARLGDSVQVDTGTGIGTITSAGVNTSI